jgi:hypothetical protein
MTQSELTEKSYINWIAEVSKRFKSAQLKAAVKVNDEMLRFYFSLGKDINTRQHQNKYGSKFYEKVSKDLKKQMPKALVLKTWEDENATLVWALKLESTMMVFLFCGLHPCIAGWLPYNRSGHPGPSFPLYYSLYRR